MGKITVNEAKGKQRHNPLMKDISSQKGNLRTLPRSSRVTKEKEETEEGFLDAASSRRILQLAKEQQEELKEEENVVPPTFGESLRSNDQDDLEESEEDEEEYSDFEEEILEEEVEIDEKDAELFNKYFQNNGTGNSINLADKILAKIQEKESQSQATERPVDAVLLPPKVIAAYEKIGQILSTYTHGKLPKLFKVLPSLKNWEDVLFVTNPEAWTPHAVYEGTKLFVSNLQANEAQKFVENVLLERFRTSIADSEDHSLNYHIYRALKKSLYKPAAFFKGFLLPLVDSFCSVREATIAASVLAKVSVPVLHSSVALTQLLQREFKPSTTVFVRVLIEKKYALPYQTIDELVFYFMRFRNAAQDRDAMDTEANESGPQLPVVWHKAFLAFAQRYKNDITDDQRDFLLETVRQRFHHAIGPEIRRELLAGQPRVPEVPTKEATMIDAF
ncbi:Bystin-domain-containing protein [Suhomyces tanzawaensis NRRL Y-17324]|uniref:Bystin-domain-containing protein n=1 Tax=Suhomyces tanzawaensis NRRL Y-17324 TaxID=984487 RepID=A0A1E4SE88_9ASCO|nr:Bystin-domain-containing protein [Suhomyces tanzawaensis NRRL Y-17324]ODV77790.1 Bystin-domain-containing protein [Suhomyces tanzawaensis NRRL Y-17324]